MCYYFLLWILIYSSLFTFVSYRIVPITFSYAQWLLLFKYHLHFTMSSPLYDILSSTISSSLYNIISDLQYLQYLLYSTLSSFEYHLIFTIYSFLKISSNIHNILSFYNILSYSKYHLLFILSYLLQNIFSYPQYPLLIISSLLFIISSPLKYIQ